jgi:hypothetical protein
LLRIASCRKWGIRSKRARPILAHDSDPHDVARRVRAEWQGVSKEIGWERGERVVHGVLIIFFLDWFTRALEVGRRQSVEIDECGRRTHSQTALGDQT